MFRSRFLSITYMKNKKVSVKYRRFYIFLHTHAFDEFCAKNFAINLVTNLPVIGLVQDVHLFANNSPKHSAQYGFSSRLVNR